MGAQQSHPIPNNHHHQQQQLPSDATNQQQPIRRKIGEGCSLFGTANSGKSTLYYLAKHILRKEWFYSSKIEFEHDLQYACCSMMGKLWSILEESERKQMKGLILERFESTLDKIEEIIRIKDWDLFDSFPQVSNFDFCELLIHVWKIPNMRELYEIRWNEISLNISQYCNEHKNSINLHSRLNLQMLENLPEFLENIENPNESFLPLTWCYECTNSSKQFEFRYGYFRDVGGARTERRTWMQSLASMPETIFLVISLSEIDQYLAEDDSQTLRIQDTKRMFKFMNSIPELMDTRKIVLFTKPDILIKKLQKGVTVNLGNSFQNET
ncbi:predicted protein [Naegleria gruberi]|uniref:Predicted protein n=1 Tax=Naegleria gruberi TaxID=5762 RepID=D2W2Q1_NAEGR|nr:uncharacterized protein NAEGRDRAFT_75669 [Naegleria gruberi]EFC36684.1 predicted protein [Naegleria gruberi]|eukprot:XP_002669428.1 predicted protein [Naegleria gruberi strain NEG-M]